MSFSTINFKKYETPTCTICQKTFKTKKNMKEHIATHNIPATGVSTRPLHTITTVFRIEKESCESNYDREYVSKMERMPRDMSLWADREKEFNNNNSNNNNTFGEAAFVEDDFPFATKSEMILHRFFVENENRLPKAFEEKIMALCQNMRDVWIVNPQEKVPTLNRVFNPEKRVESHIPSFSPPPPPPTKLQW